MVTLSRADYAVILVGMFVCGVAAVFIVEHTLRGIRRSKKNRLEMLMLERQQIREEIRAEVRAALGVEDEVWYSDDAPDDPLCLKNGEPCERAAGHSGECTPAAAR